MSNDSTPPDAWPTVFTLTFKVLSDPNDVPPAVRVRHLLKRALRDWRLKCVGGPTDAGDQAEGGDPQ